MRILLIFIDGFGLGPNDPTVNPMVRFPGTFFPSLLGGPLSNRLSTVKTDRIFFSPVDATLGVEGLPQSATGQTSLFTGLNAAKAVGRHIQAFPGPQLAGIISRAGVMGQLKQKGFSVTSANMYTPNYMELVAARKRRHSASTLMILAAEEDLRGIPDLMDGKAVYQDITNQMLSDFGYSVPLVTPDMAGGRLARIASEHHFTMFEYFQTDRIGHKKDWQLAEKICQVLDAFLLAVYQSASDDLLVIITSDHGNFEDFGVRTHTTNPVPGLLLGPNATEIGAKIQDLTDFVPAILTHIEGERLDEQGETEGGTAGAGWKPRSGNCRN